MTEAEKAFEAAERMIETVRETGADDLSFDAPETSALEQIPDSISSLSSLQILDFDDTAVRDLTPLTGLTGLTELWLNGTSVSDLTPLTGLTGLTVLGLNGTSVSDLTPLTGLTGLTMLWLDSTSVSDLTPLIDLTGLTRLLLDNTSVSDLTPLIGLTKLFQSPELHGLTFKGCAAANNDPRIAEIAEIKDNAERAQTLFDYLEEVGAPRASATQPTEQLPRAGRAPLTTRISDGRLRRRAIDGLPEQDAMARAKAGYDALRAFHDTFGKSCNTHNYSQLVAVLDGFDAAMGDAFDPDRLILIGVMGSAVTALSEDDEFAEMLPTGAAALFSQFGTQIELYVERFPAWVDYKADAAASEVTATEANAEADTFQAIAADLKSSPETDDEVASDYGLQIKASLDAQSDDAAKGLVASTRETSLVLAEEVQKQINDLERVHDDEMAKWKWRLGGFALVMLRRQAPHLKRLAARFPTQLSWLARFLEKIGPDNPPDPPS